MKVLGYKESRLVWIFDENIVTFPFILGYIGIQRIPKSISRLFSWKWAVRYFPSQDLSSRRIINMDPNPYPNMELINELTIADLNFQLDFFFVRYERMIYRYEKK